MNTRKYGNGASQITAAASEFTAKEAAKTAAAAQKTSNSVASLVQTTQKTLENSAASAASSSRAATWSISLSGIALILAIASLFYSHENHKSSSLWQNSQINILKEIRDINKQEIEKALNKKTLKTQEPISQPAK